MSDRRFDVTGLQVLASVLATITGAIAASYTGVAGTMIGAAVMSVASTAGGAVYKHYLGSTAKRLKTLKQSAPTVAHKAAERMAGPGTRNVPQRRVHGYELPGTADASGEKTIVFDRPSNGSRAAAASESARGPGRHWAGWMRGRPGWVMGIVAAVALFVGVVGSITVFELAAGKPLEAVVWHRTGSGTTVGGVVGGQPSHSATPVSRPGKQQGKASSSPSPSSSGTNSGSPSPSSSSGSPSPTSSGSPSPTPSSSSPAPTPTASSASSASAHPKAS